MENTFGEYTNEGFEQSGGSGKGKEKKRKKTSGTDRKLVCAIVALIVGIVAFVVMVVIHRYFVNYEETSSVVVATMDIPAGVTLTQENMPTYFAMEERAQTEIPANAFYSGYELINKVTAHDISAKQLITSTSVVDGNFYEGIEDPVEIAIEVSKMGQAVAGTLRAGDKVDVSLVVDISPLKEEEAEEAGELSEAPEITVVAVPDDMEQTEGVDGSVSTEQGIGEEGLVSDESGVYQNGMSAGLLNGTDMLMNGMTYSVTGKYGYVTIAENVRIVSAYDSAGVGTAAAEAEGGTQIVTVVNVVVPRSLRDTIFLAMEEGTLRLSRVVEEESDAETSVEGMAVSEGTGAVAEGGVETNNNVQTEGGVVEGGATEVQGAVEAQ